MPWNNLLGNKMSCSYLLDAFTGPDANRLVELKDGKEFCKTCGEMVGVHLNPAMLPLRKLELDMMLSRQQDTLLKLEQAKLAHDQAKLVHETERLSRISVAYESEISKVTNETTRAELTKVYIHALGSQSSGSGSKEGSGLNSPHHLPSI